MDPAGCTQGKELNGVLHKGRMQMLSKIRDTQSPELTIHRQLPRAATGLDEEEQEEKVPTYFIAYAEQLQ